MENPWFPQESDLQMVGFSHIYVSLQEGVCVWFSYSIYIQYITLHYIYTYMCMYIYITVQYITYTCGNPPKEKKCNSQKIGIILYV